jgi:hypothetical protein
VHGEEDRALVTDGWSMISDSGGSPPAYSDVRVWILAAPRRLQLAMTLGALSTNQINVLVYALNPPDNEIPPVSAPAKDRAAALLDWSSRDGIALSVIENLINLLQN